MEVWNGALAAAAEHNNSASTQGRSSIDEVIVDLITCLTTINDLIELESIIADYISYLRTLRRPLRNQPFKGNKFQAAREHKYREVSF